MWHQPLILEVMSIQLFSFFLALPFNRFFPVYAKNILNIGPTGLGLLRGSFAAGNVVGGMGLILVRSGEKSASVIASGVVGVDPLFDRVLLFVLVAAFSLCAGFDRHRHDDFSFHRTVRDSSQRA